MPRHTVAGLALLVLTGCAYLAPRSGAQPLTPAPTVPEARLSAGSVMPDRSSPPLSEESSTAPAVGIAVAPDAPPIRVDQPAWGEMGAPRAL